MQGCEIMIDDGFAKRGGGKAHAFTRNEGVPWTYVGMTGIALLIENHIPVGNCSKMPRCKASESARSETYFWVRRNDER